MGDRREPEREMAAAARRPTLAAVSALARLVDFYRAQIELIWNWRRGRRQLLLRAAVSFVVAFLSLAATAAILPGVRIDNAVSRRALGASSSAR